MSSGHLDYLYRVLKVGIIKRLGYYLILGLIAAFSLIPFRVLYIFSDLLAAVFYHLIPYRKKMILRNLKLCFPDLSEKERDQICRDSYKNLSDIILEAVKGFTMSADEILRRYKIKPNKDLDFFYSQKRPVLGLTAHLSNWEWGPYALGLSLDHHILGVYKKLSHPQLNDYMIRSRAKYDVSLSEMKETNEIMSSGSEKGAYLLMLIADQRPTDPKKGYWTTFLNQESSFFYGPQKFMEEYNLPVFFFNIHRIKRGYYEVDIETLATDPSTLKEGEIIEIYRDILEKEINLRPSDWLWSHNRWKHTRPSEATLH